MKKRLSILVILGCLALSKVPAQSNTTDLIKDIRILLVQFPAQDSGYLEKNMQAIGRLGEKGLEKMALLHGASDKVEHAEIEYALNAFSVFTTLKGRAEMKKQAETAYLNALQIQSNEESHAFLIRQLQIVGSDRAVPELQNFLGNERLCDPAARALVKINTPSSRHALVSALKNSTTNCRLSITEALGDARCREAAPILATYLHDADAQFVKLDLYALAHIADPASETVLATAAKKSGYVYESTGATAAYIDYARQLAADGHITQCEKIAQGIFSMTTGEKQVPARIAALKLLVDTRHEGSVPLLIKTMDEKNTEVRRAALKFALTYASDAAVKLWLQKLATSNNTVSIEIIEMLGGAGNAVSLPVLVRYLHDPDEDIRIAAIKAATRIGNQKVLPDLLISLETASQREADAIAQTIQTMKGAQVIDQLADVLPKLQRPSAKSAVIQILGERKADKSVEDVLALAKNEDAGIRHAACAALPQLVNADELPQLNALLVDSKDTVDIAFLQSALVVAYSWVPDISKRVQLIKDRMDHLAGDKTFLYLKVLAGVGGRAALQIVEESVTNGNLQLKASAIAALSAWPDISAAPPLLDICRREDIPIYFEQALMGYIGLASRSDIPAEQKLLMLRDAMAVAKTVTQKTTILKETARCKTFPSVIFAGNYLDDADLRHAAADAVVKIALPQKTWNGQMLQRLLEKSIPLLDGPDADYERQAVRKHLEALPAGNGFVPLFNEKDLSGWKGLVDNPIAREKMSADTLAAKQKIADDRMRKGWFVKNGELIFSGEGDNLCTEKKYGDFEMYVDWKITKDGDAGIYLRGSPQVQIWDTARVSAGAQVGSGGLYNNTVYPSKPLIPADNAVGEWNNFHILMVGDRVTVYLNGQLVVDNIILENYWDRKLPIFPTEQIELQAHGTYVAYRDLYIKEIPRKPPYVLSNNEKLDGFKPLFDGTNMYEWTGNTTDYIIEDGNIAVYPRNGGHGNLYTKEEYANFVYRFEFQLTPGANNGIGIRAPLEGDAAYVGMEIQVLDNEAEMYRNLHPYQYHGSVYGVIPAKRGFLKPVGEWNVEEITANGSRIKVVLNGTTILDGDIDSASVNGTMDGKEHPGLKRKTGHIGFLGHGDIVKFRNMRIKTLPDER